MLEGSCQIKSVADATGPTMSITHQVTLLSDRPPTHRHGLIRVHQEPVRGREGGEE